MSTVKLQSIILSQAMEFSYSGARLHKVLVDDLLKQRVSNLFYAIRTSQRSSMFVPVIRENRLPSAADSYCVFVYQEIPIAVFSNPEFVIEGISSRRVFRCK